MAGLGLMAAVAVAPVLFEILVALSKGLFTLAIIAGFLWALYRIGRRADE